MAKKKYGPIRTEDGWRNGRTVEILELLKKIEKLWDEGGRCRGCAGPDYCLSVLIPQMKTALLDAMYGPTMDDIVGGLMGGRDNG